MAVTCEECYDSPTIHDTYNNGGDPSATTHLRVKGTQSYNEAKIAAVRWINENRQRFGDLNLKSIDIKPIAGTNCWDVELEYGYRSSSQNVLLDAHVSTTGGTAHVERSPLTVMSRSCISMEPAYDFGGAVGVDGDEIKGVDIKTPNFTWNQTQGWPRAVVNAAFWRNILDCTAKVNLYPWRGFDAGEVLFEGVTDGALCHEVDENTGRLHYYWKLTYSFSVQPNLYNIRVGDAVVNKKGWEYMWVLWETITQSNHTSKIPRNVCIEQFYEPRDFNCLGLVEV